MRCAVLGAGSWGTAFARRLCLSGHTVTLWARRPELARSIIHLNENPDYLPGVVLPSELAVTSDLSEDVNKAEVVFLVIPSFAMGEVAERVASHLSPGIPAVHLAKGLEQGTGRRLSEVLIKTLDEHPVFALSGPSHAEEVGLDMPTALVLAGKDLRLGEELQRALTSECLRVYLSDDVIGVEYCGVVKNVIAIGTGISDGLGYGDNTRAALITRGLAEMSRFGLAVGARPETFYGLAGLGDLVVTATSMHSRNRWVGCQIGEGKQLREVLASTHMVAEGVFSVTVLRKLARSFHVEMPIAEAVYRVLYQGEAAKDQIPSLMLRPLKRECG